MEFNMAFNKIKTKKKSTYIADQIINSIRKGIYKVGDKLPSERQIVKKTGVSRPSVREALSALQIVGLIESKSGDGAYICQPAKNDNIEFRIWSILEKTRSPFEIWEARKTLEPDVAGLAAEKSISQDIKNLKKALRSMHKMAEKKDNKRFLEADQKFHMTLATITKNSTIEWIIYPLLQNMTQELWIEIKKNSLLNEEHVKISLFLHDRILKAVENKNKKIARKEIKRHFRELEKYIFKDYKK